MKFIIYFIFSTLSLNNVFANNDDVIFNLKKSTYTKDTVLQLSSNSSTIYYTTNGKIPQIGTSYTKVYQGVIPITQLKNSKLIILNQLHHYTADSTFFYSQTKDDNTEYNLAPPIPEKVSKKTIIRACTGDCSKVYTRVYGIDTYIPSGYEVHIIVDTIEHLIHEKIGIMSANYGFKTQWVFSPKIKDMPKKYAKIFEGQPDTIKLANYDILGRKELIQPNIFNAEGRPNLFDSLPSHFKGVKATVLIYKDDEFKQDETSVVRVNGNGTAYLPIKPFKVKMEPISKIDFIKTGNFIARPIAKVGINSSVLYKITKDIPPFISRNTAQGVLYLYNGKYAECYGQYMFASGADKKHAKQYWEIEDPIKIINYNSTYEYFFGKDTSIFSETYSILKEKQNILKLTRDSLNTFINDKAWVIFATIYGWGKPGSSMDKEGKYYGNSKGGYITPIIKDADSFFHLNFENKKNNQLGFFITGDPKYAFDLEKSEDFDNFPKDAIYASFFVEENKNYYQNLPLDILEKYLAYKKTKPILNQVIKEYKANKADLDALNNINNPLDSFSQEQKFIKIDSFLRNANDIFLQDWIDVFHNGYSLNDTFNIIIENKTTNSFCYNSGGVVYVNSLEFKESGKRKHLKDFPIKISAKANAGYQFLKWLEYPDSSSTFILNNHSTDNITLTPIFKQNEELCYGRENLVLNEILPWSSSDIDKVEIYNPNSTPVSLCDLYLSDDSLHLKKYKFNCDSNSIINSKNYLVIDFKDSNSGEITIYDWALSKKGETLYLSNSDSIIDQITWSNCTKDVSYGKCKTKSKLVKFENPTLGAENTCNKK